MAGQQFQYDDSGNTFFYFLTSFVGLIVIPATYYLWPRDQHAGEGLRGGLCEALTPLLGSEGGVGPVSRSPGCVFLLFFFFHRCVLKGSRSSVQAAFRHKGRAQQRDPLPLLPKKGCVGKMNPKVTWFGCWLVAGAWGPAPLLGHLLGSQPCLWENKAFLP